MVKKILLTLMALPASVFSIIILMNNPEPIGLVIVFLLFTFIALAIYVQFLDGAESKLAKKDLLKHKHS